MLITLLTFRFLVMGICLAVLGLLGNGRFLGTGSDRVSRTAKQPICVGTVSWGHGIPLPPTTGIQGAPRIDLSKCLTQSGGISSHSHLRKCKDWLHSQSLEPAVLYSP